jgi:hypothetical protein
MMNNQQAAPVPQKARVSILERLIPSMSLGIAAISGIVGAFLIRRFFDIIRNAETAGIDAISVGSAHIEVVVGVILVVAALFGAVAIIVSAVRMFRTNTKSSPPGLLFPVVSFFGLLSPAIIAVGLWMMIDSISRPDGNLGLIGPTIGMMMLAAIAAGAIAICMLLTFSFVPFNARTGRKYSPLIFLLATEAMIIALAGLFFWAAYTSMQLTDADFFDSF